MIITSFRNFLDDESGAYTIWSLIWFSIYVALGGMAVDMTDAYRTKMLLQSTADASVLAAVISLPDETDGRSQAVNYSQDNMLQNVHGTVVRPEEVVFGTWTDANETFVPNTAEPNAAMVTARRAASNENPLATNFLRIWGLVEWDVNALAIATKYLPECLTNNGLVAGNKVDVTSNNQFDDICIHGENLIIDPGQDYAIDLGNNNQYFDGVQVSMPDLDDLNGRPNVCTNNPGLCEPGTLAEGSLVPGDANVVAMDKIVNGLAVDNGDGTWDAGPLAPDYIGVDALGAPLTDDIVQAGKTKDFKGPFVPGHIYVYDNCTSNQLVQLDDGTPVDSVVILANCKIKGNSGVTLKDAIVISTSVGNGSDQISQHSIDFASDTTIGGIEFCDDDSGQVHLYSYASMHVAAGPAVYGLRMVAIGDIHFTANNDVSGISAEAGRNLTATANGSFEFCGGTFTDLPIEYYYRLVR